MNNDPYLPTLEYSLTLLPNKKTLRIRNRVRMDINLILMKPRYNNPLAQICLVP